MIFSVAHLHIISASVSSEESEGTHRMRPHHCHAYIRVHIPIRIVSASTSASVSDNVGLSHRGSRRVDAVQSIPRCDDSVLRRKFTAHRGGCVRVAHPPQTHVWGY